MKLKTIVSSLAALGLVSASAFAAPVAPEPTKTAGHTPLTAAQKRIAINANQDNAFANPMAAITNWASHTRITGQVDVDTAMGKVDGDKYWSTGIGLGNANLYVDMDLGSWIHGHFALEGQPQTPGYTNPVNGKFKPYSGVGTYAFEGFENVNVGLSEATAELSNFDKCGAWLRVGLQFLNFGTVNHDSITDPLPQLLEEANSTAIVAGYMFNNVGEGALNVDGYIFQGHRQFDKHMGSSRIAPGYGGDVTYSQQHNKVGFNAHLGVLGNLYDTTFGQKLGVLTMNQETLPGVSFDGDVNYALPGGVKLDAMVNVVSAMHSSDFLTYTYKGNTKRATPFAAGVETGVGFKGPMNRFSQVVLGGQITNGLSDVLLPRARVLAFYRINLLSSDNAYADNFYAKAEYDHNFAYGKDYGFPSATNDDNLFVFRLGAKL